MRVVYLQGIRIEQAAALIGLVSFLCVTVVLIFITVSFWGLLMGFSRVYLTDGIILLKRETPFVQCEPLRIGVS